MAIISRGNYVPPGKALGVGERKLHLLIEGSSDMNVRQARLEIQRVLEEETIRIGTQQVAGGAGRYSIL